MSTPTLLGLPVEVRRQILQEAFLVSCSPGPLHRFANPFGLQLYFASSVPSAKLDLSTYGGWGREQMSTILRLNRQLHSEAIEVLYGGPFVFEFCNSTRANNVRLWLDVLGDKKKLVKHVGVSVVLDLEMLSIIGGPYVDGAKKQVEVKREAWSILKEELVSLQSVRVQIDFVSRIRGGPPGRERLLDEIMGLLGAFRGVKTIRIEQGQFAYKEFEERAHVLETCIERVERGEWAIAQ
jgi:hypothetical protein